MRKLRPLHNSLVAKAIQGTSSSNALVASATVGMIADMGGIATGTAIGIVTATSSVIPSNNATRNSRVTATSSAILNNRVNRFPNARSDHRSRLMAF